VDAPTASVEYAKMAVGLVKAALWPGVKGFGGIEMGFQDMAKVAEKTVTEENKESVKKSERYRTLIQFTKMAPNAAIEVAWQNVEDRLFAIGRKYRIREQVTWNGGIIIPIEEVEKILPSELVTQIKALQALRNKVAQSSDFKPSPEEAEEFVLLASVAAQNLERIATQE
jgi:hypothetical protein